MIKESSVWKWIKNLPEKVGPELFFQRLESRGTGSGIPDVLFSYNGICGFIELKSWNTLSSDQRIWIRKYLLSGGLVFLLYVDKHISYKILIKMIHSDIRRVNPTGLARVYPLHRAIELPPLLQRLSQPGYY